LHIGLAAYNNGFGWKGRPWEETALYELHVRTFGPEATFDGVRKRRGHLADLGVTAIESMPLPGSPGRRNRRASLPAGALLDG
jgi:1,4-alpha-glucan branching enzyme